MTGPRTLVLTHLERSGAIVAGQSGRPDPRRVRLGHGKAGGRLANMESPAWRHRDLLLGAEGATGSGSCKVVRISGMRQSWSCGGADSITGGPPEAGDLLIAQGGLGYRTWYGLRVVAALWWDFGRTLELLVRVEREVHHGGAEAQRGAQQDQLRRQHARAAAPGLAALSVALCLCASVFIPIGATMADQSGGQSGTYAHLPLEEMNAYLQRLARFPDDARREALPKVAEAVLSEAQTNSPRLTGFLSDSHVVLEDDTDKPGGSITIGANTSYALPVHETHPTKKRWFLKAVVAHFPRIMGAALTKLARERGAR